MNILFLQIGLAGSYLGVILAHLIPTLPYVVFTLAGAYARYDKNYEFQSLVLGASPLRTFLTVTLPLIAPSLVVAALFAFLISWSQYLLTLPILFFSAVSGGNPVTIAVLPLIFLAPPVLVIAATARKLDIGEVLKDFSLSVNDRELVALLGPSGSGKSTLLKLITGIERPDAGDIKFDGLSILNIPPNKRGAVFMFQKSYLFPFLSVAENIGFGLKVQGVSSETIRSEVARMLDLIGLPGTERRKSAQLSGGEQQRVALARAFVTRPKLLLLDEPLSSLDTEVRMNLQEAIRAIQRELGITTILVTHDLGEAMAMSDRLALLLKGEIVAVDKPENLFHHPPSLAAAQFMGVSTFLSGNPLTVKNEACSTSEKILAIRPEHIRIQKEVCKNSMQGVVNDCVFRGEYIEYQVDVNDVTVRARIPMPAPMFPHGEQVHVRFPVEHLFEVGN